MSNIYMWVHKLQNMLEKEGQIGCVMRTENCSRLHTHLKQCFNLIIGFHYMIKNDERWEWWHIAFNRTTIMRCPPRTFLDIIKSTIFSSFCFLLNVRNYVDGQRCPLEQTFVSSLLRSPRLLLSRQLGKLFTASNEREEEATSKRSRRKAVFLVRWNGWRLSELVTARISQETGLHW